MQTVKNERPAKKNKSNKLHTQELSLNVLISLQAKLTINFFYSYCIP